VEVDETLVDPHLELVPGVGTLSGGCLTGGDPELLGGEPDRSGNLELLVDGTTLEVGADLLEVLDVPGGEGDADAVEGIGGIDIFLESRHFYCGGDGWEKGRKIGLGGVRGVEWRYTLCLWG